MRLPIFTHWRAPEVTDAWAERGNFMKYDNVVCLSTRKRWQVARRLREIGRFRKATSGRLVVEKVRVP